MDNYQHFYQYFNQGWRTDNNIQPYHQPQVMPQYQQYPAPHGPVPAAPDHLAPHLYNFHPGPHAQPADHQTQYLYSYQHVAPPPCVPPNHHVPEVTANDQTLHLAQQHAAPPTVQYAAPPAGHNEPSGSSASHARTSKKCRGGRKGGRKGGRQLPTDVPETPGWSGQ